MKRSGIRLPRQLATLATVALLALAGCGSSREGTISLASYGKTRAEKSVAATAAGMPGAVDRAVVTRMLDQAKAGSRTRRLPVAWRSPNGGAR
jgi:hypothetical protein